MKLKKKFWRNPPPKNFKHPPWKFQTHPPKISDTPPENFRLPRDQARYPPPVDRHTHVNLLPWPNFVAAGNHWLIHWNNHWNNLKTTSVLESSFLAKRLAMNDWSRTSNWSVRKEKFSPCSYFISSMKFVCLLHGCRMRRSTSEEERYKVSVTF